MDVNRDKRTLYLSDNEKGIEIHDFSDPKNVSKMGSFYNAADVNYYDIGVTSDDKMVYYLTKIGSPMRLNKANVSNKTDPKFLDSVSI